MQFLLDEPTNVPCSVVALAFYVASVEPINLHNLVCGCHHSKEVTSAPRVLIDSSFPAIQLITFMTNQSLCPPIGLRGRPAILHLQPSPLIYEAPSRSSTPKAE